MSKNLADSAIFKLFNPDSVAIFGASQNFVKWGTIILHNILLGGYTGKIYPINPKYEEVLGLKAYKKIGDVPGPIDIAVIALRRDFVPEIIMECAFKSIKAVVLITAGFAEAGNQELQDKIVKIARTNSMRLVGPNGMGIFSADVQLNAIMAPLFPKYGKVSFISQSGNLGTVAMRWAMDRGVGFNKFVSSGNEADLQMPEYLNYLAKDNSTKVVAAYIEGIPDGRALISALTHAAQLKPTVVLKGGKTKAGNAATASHTGSVARTSPQMLEKVLSQTGALVAEDLGELFDLVSVFSGQPCPKGNKVGILTVGGGWGVVAADACEKQGLEVAKLPEELIAEIDKILPPFWSRQNPVDTVGMLGPVEVYEKLLELMVSSDAFDGILFLGFGFYSYFTRLWSESPFVPKEVLGLYDLIIKHESRIIDKLVDLIEKYEKPIIVATLSSSRDSKSIQRLEDRGYPALPNPESAARAFAKMVHYSERSAT
ncbi:MAG: acetate--CoA ligase family protein [Candidatus Hodarchaeales archaeon]|jgi:acyl-CoA synthetase (NDP forming)